MSPTPDAVPRKLDARPAATDVIPASPQRAVLPAQLRYDDAMQCMRCGFCLPACPTFGVSGNELDSPRGRISLVRAVAEGTLSPDDPGFRHALDECIGCLACQEACPSGVRYGEIFEAARDVIEEHRGPLVAGMRRSLFNVLFQHPPVLRALAAMLWLYQRSGLDALARRCGVLERMGRVGAFAAVLPRVRTPFAARRSTSPSRNLGNLAYTGAQQTRAWAALQSGRLGNSRARGQDLGPPRGWEQARTSRAAPSLARRRGNPEAGTVASSSRAGARTPPAVRVALFTGCIMDVLYRQVNETTASLLERAGCTVIVPTHQGCCGALHAHNGQLGRARHLAKQNIIAFENAGADYVVSNAGGCGAQFFEYPGLLADEPGWQSRAQRFLARVVDVSELLVQLGTLEHLGPVHARVAFQDSCHLRNVMGVWREPRALLQCVPGVQYVELPEAARCCGSGGVYNLTAYATSMRVLDDKVRNVRDTDVDIVCTANPGCQLQMALGLRRAGLSRVRVLHIVELLEEAVRAGTQA